MKSISQQYQLDQLRREEMMRKAARSNHAHEEQRLNDKPGLYSSALTRVGKTLSTMGEALQERYDENYAHDQQDYPLDSMPHRAA